jgi:hypothetical protein
LEQCQACHTDVETAEDLVNIRMAGSLVDYDGDGDMEEGVYYEIEGCAICSTEPCKPIRWKQPAR